MAVSLVPLLIRNSYGRGLSTAGFSSELAVALAPLPRGTVRPFPLFMRARQRQKNGEIGEVLSGHLAPPPVDGGDDQRLQQRDREIRRSANLFMPGSARFQI